MAAKKKSEIHTGTNNLDVNAAAAEGSENKIARQEPKVVLPAFESFTTTAPLLNGLCIVRKLANGKYELLNLSSVDKPSLFGNLEFTRMLEEDQNAGRLQAFEEAEKKWKTAGLGVGQALRGIGKSIPALLHQTLFGQCTQIKAKFSNW